MHIANNYLTISRILLLLDAPEFRAFPFECE